MVINPEDDDNDNNHKSLYYEVLYFVGMTNIAFLILSLKNSCHKTICVESRQFLMKNKIQIS